MNTRIPVLAALVLAGVLLFASVGCGGASLEEEFEAEFSGQGIPTKSIDVDVTPHESQVVMDLMILESNGITNAREEDLIHATVTLESGEEVTAVKLRGSSEIYTYKQ